MRIDKLLANMGFGSRKEVKALLKKKSVLVNQEIIKNGSIHVDPSKDEIRVNNEIVHYRKYIYLMLNKPQGVISATEDIRERTVIDLLPDKYKIFQPFPVGRLDKDTEGFLLLTNDGKLAHQLLSPKKDVEKTYFAVIEGNVTERDVEAFIHGVTLDDGYVTKPAKLRILTSDTTSKVEVTITEGKFHQVKRMFLAVNKKVTYLKRLSMGDLQLDPSLSLGSFRELYEDEQQYVLTFK